MPYMFNSVFSLRNITMTAASVCALIVFSGPVNAQSSSAAAMEIRFQQMEKEIRRLTGQLEEQQYEIRRLKDAMSVVEGELQKSKSDNTYAGSEEGSTLAQSDRQIIITNESVEAGKAAAFEQTQSAHPSQTLGTLNKSATNGSVKASDGAPKDYDYAYSFIRTRNFDRAEKEFGAFIQNYPGHDLVSNAQYWYGETFYVRGNYDKSARIFAESYQKHPQGPKASSNLLKLGMSLVGLKKNEDACIAFKQLKKEYSKSSIPVLKRADSEMKKIGCS